MQDLGEKIAVVTGGGGGIGRALGERFLAEGMKVALADIDEPLLEATVDELSTTFDDVLGIPTDVSRLESVEHLRDAALDRFGAVHLVCNNAGIPSGSDGALWQHHVNDWRWAVDVNVFGVIHGINTFVPLLLEQGGPGHIVNTSSSNGTFAPLSNSAVYATTKAAVTNVTECLWGQLRAIDSPVQVSLLLPSTRTPGALNTGIWRPGRNRPERYSRPGQAPVEGRDALTPFVEQLELHGQELVFAPLAEVADIALEGILADQFWIYLPGERSSDTINARATSMRDATPPDYLVRPPRGTCPRSTRRREHTQRASDVHARSSPSTPTSSVCRSALWPAAERNVSSPGRRYTAPGVVDGPPRGSLRSSRAHTGASGWPLVGDPRCSEAATFLVRGVTKAWMNPAIESSASRAATT